MGEDENIYDVIVIGGGPAGLATAVWCIDLGLRPLVLESEEKVGGQLNRIFNQISNYLGFKEIASSELRDRFVIHASTVGAEIVTNVSIASVDLTAKHVRTSEGKIYRGRSIVVASGVRRRALGVQGEIEFRGKGIMESGVKEVEKTAGKHVVVVGGGDAAAENAIIFADRAKKVTLIHRREKLSARQEFQDRLLKLENVEILRSTRISSIEGGNFVEAVRTINSVDRTEDRIATDLVLIRIGVVPNTELFREQLEMDRRGYIKVDSNCSTRLDRVYAVGDVANPAAPTLNSAAGMGATAAKNIHRDLNP